MVKNRSCAGYSLLEVLVALVVIASAQALVVPALGSVVNALRLRSSADALYSSLALARSEAVIRNSRVVVCKSVSGTACSVEGDWHQGWIVFHDANNNARRDLDEEIVYRESALPASIHFNGNEPVQHYVSYNSVGRTSLTTGAFQAGTLTVCIGSSKATEARQIIINSVGRIRQAKATVHACA
jgi:type IV fimbrial biogenesis protein FimT